MALVVQKYGGSSLATPRHIRLAAERIASVRRRGIDVVVVVSAMGDTTDHLLALARDTVQQPPLRELDMLLTAGERISMSLLAMSLQELHIPAISFTGSQSGIITSSDHGRATIREIRPQRIQAALREEKVVIIAGFQGVSEQKEITTLGRGGSDTTAVALAAALAADRCEILTDVAGIFSADPRIVSEAKLFSHLSYETCLEMASLGAKMQARSIELAKRYGVEVWIGSSQEQESSGTLVGKSEVAEVTMEQTAVTAITTKDGFCFFSVDRGSGGVMRDMANLGVVLRWFTVGPDGMSFLCEESSASDVRRVLQASNAKVHEVQDVALVSIVGDGFLHSPQILLQCMDSIADAGAGAPLLVVSNSLSLSVAVPAEAKAAVAQRLHQQLIV
jgi:aspartate kinase